MTITTGRFLRGGDKLPKKTGAQLANTVSPLWLSRMGWSKPDKHWDSNKNYDSTVTDMRFSQQICGFKPSTAGT